MGVFAYRYMAIRARMDFSWWGGIGNAKAEPTGLAHETGRPQLPVAFCLRIGQTPDEEDVKF